MNLNQQIQEIRANLDSGASVEDLVTEWCNAAEVEVREDGSIWIANA